MTIFGGRLNLRKTMLVSSGETVLASYSGTVPTPVQCQLGQPDPPHSFDVEAMATDEDDQITMVTFSAWADGEQFARSMLGDKGANDTYSVHIDAESAVLGIDSFLINITAMDSDGNSARGTLMVKVGVDDNDETGLVADEHMM